MDHRAPSQAGSGSRRKVSCATRQLAGGRDAELRSGLARGRGLLARLGGERPLPARDRRRLPLRLGKAAFSKGGGGGKIGRESCRGRGEISGGAGSFKKKKQKNKRGRVKQEKCNQEKKNPTKDTQQKNKKTK